jgi:uncharacterized membrane protein YgcG
MEAVSRLEDVRTFETRGGNTRFVVRDSDGNEYTTFREEIGERAQQLRGQQVRISYHETQRGRYTNVYLDQVDPVAPASAASGASAASSVSGPGAEAAADTDAEEAAWRTAVEAAPWLVGKDQAEVGPDELYERLKPFEERVAEDIRRDRRSSDDDGRSDDSGTSAGGGTSDGGGASAEDR